MNNKPLNSKPANISEVISFLADFQPKVYLLHLIIGETKQHLTLAFGTQVDRINFEQHFCHRYKGEIHLLSRSEPKFNPKVIETIDNINETIK